MKCSRCQGLMVVDTCLNMEGIQHNVWVHEWRCLNCGEIQDARTLANRKLRQQPVKNRTHVGKEAYSIRS